MQVFYAPGIQNETYVLDENESRHLIRVLRMTRGDIVRLIDGKGNLFEGFISKPDQGNCEITITNVFREFEKRNYRLHIAISPLKNTERFEWFVEKSVEIGIDEITPLICKNTEKPGINTGRINKIIVSAIKQSLKAYKPVLNSPCYFNDFINLDLNGIRMLAYCKEYPEKSKIDQVYSKGEIGVILLGPEGDFSEDEINCAVNKGFKPVHLGNSRLRTETAGIAACHSMYFLNQ